MLEGQGMLKTLLGDGDTGRHQLHSPPKLLAQAGELGWGQAIRALICGTAEARDLHSLLLGWDRHKQSSILLLSS